MFKKKKEQHHFSVKQPCKPIQLMDRFRIYEYNPSAGGTLGRWLNNSNKQ